MNPLDDAEIISRYTRAQAIDDGTLIDLMQRPTSERPELDDLRSLVLEAGCRYPVAMTAAAFSQSVHYLDDRPLPECQDLKGRLWDVLWMLKLAMRRVDGDTVLFQVIVRHEDKGDWQSNEVPLREGRHVNRMMRLTTLKCVCGPGDDLSPVLTIMQPDE